MANLLEHRKFKQPVTSPLRSPLVSPITDLDTAAGGNTTGTIKVMFGKMTTRAIGARTNVIVQQFKLFKTNIIAAEEVSGGVSSKFGFAKIKFGHDGFVSNWVEALGPIKMILGTGSRVQDARTVRVQFETKAEGDVFNGSHGHIAQTFKKLKQSATGEAKFAGGVIAQTFKKLRQSAAGISASNIGTASSKFTKKLTTSAAGHDSAKGSAAVAFKKMSQNAVGWQSPEFGTIAVRFKRIQLNEQGVEKFVGSIDDMRFKGLQQNIQGTVFNDGRAVTIFPRGFRSDATGWDSAVGAIHMIFPKFGTSAHGGQGKANGTITQTFKLIKQLVTAAEEEFGTVAQTFPKMVQSAAGTQTIPAAGDDDMISHGRIALASGKPFMDTDYTACSTIYFTPAIGNVVPVWDGTKFSQTAFSELSQALSDSTKSPAAAAANSIYDVFVWSDGGTLRVSRGPAWSSSTSRGTGSGTTELQMVNGIWTNKNAITNGPAAGYGTYVGTIATDGNTQLNFMQNPTAAAGGSNNRLDVWNMYNRRHVVANVRDSTDTWTYGTSAFRATNNSTSNRVTMVVGIAEDVVEATCQAAVILNTTGSWLTITAIGLDSTTAMAAGCYPGVFGANTSFTVHVTTRGSWNGSVGIGQHYLQWLEYSLVSRTFYGDNGAPTTEQNGLFVKAMM